MINEIPCSTPMHMVHREYRPPVRRGRYMAVATRRAPLFPAIRSAAPPVRIPWGAIGLPSFAQAPVKRSQVA